MSTSLQEVRLRSFKPGNPSPCKPVIHCFTHSHPFIEKHTAGGDKQILNEGPKGRGRAGRQEKRWQAGRQAGPGEMCVTVHSELCCVCDGGRSVAHPASVIATVCPRDAPYA